MKKPKREPAERAAKGPVAMLQAELQALRRELRATLRAYSARLEVSLAQTTVYVAESLPADELTREQMHQIRDLTLIVRDRRLKPEKGRRKDVRKIDEIIEEMEAVVKHGRPD